MVAGSQQVDNVMIKLLDRPRREIRQRCQLVHFLSAGELAQTPFWLPSYDACVLLHMHTNIIQTRICVQQARASTFSHTFQCVGVYMYARRLNTFKLDRDKPIYKDPGEKQRI